MFPTLIFVVAIVGAVIAIGALNFWLAKQRREALAAVAAGLGMTFAPKGEGALDDGLAALPVFQRGHGRKAVNALSGQIEDVQARILDYFYITFHGTGQMPHTQTITAFGLGNAPLPAFTLGPKGALHFLANLVSGRDIEFKAHAEFARHYCLRGPEEAAIRTLFDDKVLTFLDANPGWSVEAAGRWLVVYKPNRKVKPQEVAGFLEKVFEVFNKFGQA
jgi:hypothetical protein